MAKRCAIKFHNHRKGGIMSESDEAQLWADLADCYEANALRHEEEAKRCRQEAEDARRISHKKALLIHSQRYLRVVS